MLEKHILFVDWIVRHNLDSTLSLECFTAQKIWKICCALICGLKITFEDFFGTLAILEKALRVTLFKTAEKITYLVGGLQRLGEVEVMLWPKEARENSKPFKLLHNKNRSQIHAQPNFRIFLVPIHF